MRGETIIPPIPVKTEIHNISSFQRKLESSMIGTKCLLNDKTGLTTQTVPVPVWIKSGMTSIEKFSK